jgi:hypothetical protein
MATPVTTGRSHSDRSLARPSAKESVLGASTKRNPKATGFRHGNDGNAAASKAVAVAFARIVAERYPGTSWLPVKPPRSDDRLVVPAGKVLRLLPGPANVNASGGIGHPAAPAAYERAPYEYSSNPGA